jgi:hypothetical protein
MQRAIRKVQRYSAAFLEVKLVGIILSIDSQRREILIEPLEITIGGAT